MSASLSLDDAGRLRIRIYRAVRPLHAQAKASSRPTRLAHHLDSEDHRDSCSEIIDNAGKRPATLTAYVTHAKNRPERYLRNIPCCLRSGASRPWPANIGAS